MGYKGLQGTANKRTRIRAKDVPAPVVNSGNFEGCHFQLWGARELSEEQYAIEAAAEVTYCFVLNFLWCRRAENGNQRIAKIKLTGPKQRDIYMR